MKQRNQTAYEAAMTDKAYQKFRPKMFSCDGYSEAEFNKAAWFSTGLECRKQIIAGWRSKGISFSPWKLKGIEF